VIHTKCKRKEQELLASIAELKAEIEARNNVIRDHLDSLQSAADFKDRVIAHCERLVSSSHAKNKNTHEAIYKFAADLGVRTDLPEVRLHILVPSSYEGIVDRIVDVDFGRHLESPEISVNDSILALDESNDIVCFSKVVIVAKFRYEFRDTITKSSQLINRAIIRHLVNPRNRRRPDRMTRGGLFAKVISPEDLFAEFRVRKSQ